MTDNGNNVVSVNVNVVDEDQEPGLRPPALQGTSCHTSTGDRCISAE
jgi:hypothetical protein